jgi:hypothetical protein
MGETPQGTAAVPRSRATSVTLAVLAPVALLVAFVPYAIGGLLAHYGTPGSDPGGFAGYGVAALVIGLGVPLWALVWGIVDIRRTRQLPGSAALLLGAFTSGVALCVILPGAIMIIRASAMLATAYG